MKTSSQGIQLIKDFEGLRLEAYRCPAGKWTIGYGHTRNVIPGMKITSEVADKLLMDDLISVEKCLNESNLALNQNQFDALSDFVFNFGTDKFLKSTLFKIVRISPDDARISEELLKWNKGRVSGVLQVIPGLTRRRKAESLMYFTK
ncbi:MAG: lysozyme [Bacteroidetes bacterium HGW-Bacteroidetes-7]|nr:MAG: lysozyme [Bacteroidetes bacterium HGW-Bacteroidetes-7]